MWKIQITEKHSGKIWFFDLREGAKELEVKQNVELVYYRVCVCVFTNMDLLRLVLITCNMILLVGMGVVDFNNLLPLNDFSALTNPFKN